MNKFDVTYVDERGFQRHHYQKASDEKEALINAWLNNKQVKHILDVRLIG